MTYARIYEGQIAQTIDDIAAVPEHKRSNWLPIEGDAPEYDSWTHVLAGPTLDIQEARVLRVWEVIERPLIERQVLVRAEAQRRIIAFTGTATLLDCMIKQSNANMRANDLNDKRLNGDVLTESEVVEAAALRAMAASIKAIRASSNALEPDPPEDYASDDYWPET